MCYYVVNGYRWQTKIKEKYLQICLKADFAKRVVVICNEMKWEANNDYKGFHVLSLLSW